jgi:hypothetical protein
MVTCIDLLTKQRQVVMDGFISPGVTFSLAMSLTAARNSRPPCNRTPSVRDCVRWSDTRECPGGC